MEMSLWLDAFMAALKKTFDERVWFVGLQGSRGRGTERMRPDPPDRTDGRAGLP